MCANCKDCQIIKSGMMCNLYEDQKEFFKDTKQVIFCSGKTTK